MAKLKSLTLEQLRKELKKEERNDRAVKTARGRTAEKKNLRRQITARRLQRKFAGTVRVSRAVGKFSSRAAKGLAEGARRLEADQKKRRLDPEVRQNTFEDIINSEIPA